MTVERDIAGFVIPFAAGAALLTVLLPIFSAYQTYTTAGASAVASICLVLLMHPSHKRMSSNTLWFIIITLGLCCGIITSLAGNWHRSLAPDADGPIWNAALHFGSGMKSTISSIPFADTQSNAVISALITGDRSDLEPGLLESFRKSGASHILALSGMHLGIIYGMLKLILSLIGNRPGVKVIKSATIVAACGFYTMSAGAGASLVRAFIFITIAEIASGCGRSKNLKDLLLTSLLIQLALFPHEIKDVRFQLSYAAIAGIAYIYPQLRDLWPQKSENEGFVLKGLRWIWYSAAISVSCQITTGPIAYAYFGTFPKYFLITNLMAVPLVSAIIPFSILTTALTAIGICPSFLVSVTECMVQAMLYCLNVIGSI